MSECCQPLPDDPKLRKLTWAQVLMEFAASMAKWTKSGFAFATPAEHCNRYQICSQNCPHFQNYQCKKCYCIAYLKTKVASESCPDYPKRWDIVLPPRL